MVANFRVIPQLKFGFLYNNFRETYSSRLALRGEPPFRISQNSTSKYGDTVKNSITSLSKV